MYSFNNSNFAGMNYTYPFVEGGHSSGDQQFPDVAASYSLFDSKPPIAGPSMSQDWYLNPSPDECSDQSEYQESTLLDAPRDQFVGPYTSLTEPAYSLDTGESRLWLIAIAWANTDDRLRYECPRAERTC